MHTDYGLMKKWANRIGHSVIKEKSSRRNNKIKETNPSAFAVLVPGGNPPVHNETCLIGISISFSSGTTINIRQADADSIIRLVSLYERKDGAHYSLTSGNKYYLYQGFFRMNLGIDGLYRLLRCEMQHLSPISGDAFIFFGKRRNGVKILRWDGDGFLLYYKRLERGAFRTSCP